MSSDARPPAGREPSPADGVPSGAGQPDRQGRPDPAIYPENELPVRADPPISDESDAGGAGWPGNRTPDGEGVVTAELAAGEAPEPGAAVSPAGFAPWGTAPGKAGPAAAPAASPRLPQPGLPLAFALTLVPLAAQVAVGVVLLVLVLVAWNVIRGPNAPMEAVMEQAQVLLFPVGTLTVVLVSLGIAYLFMGRPMGRLLGWRSLTASQALVVLLFIFPLSIVTSELTNHASDALSAVQPEWLAQLRGSQSAAFEEFARQWLPLVLLAGCVLPGIGEEILCRGVISRGLIARHGVWRGSLWASFLFGAMHLEPIQATGACLLGLGLQFVFLATRSLAAPMIAHAVNNAFAFLLLRTRETFPIPGISHLPADGNSHTPLLVLVPAVAALAASTVLLWRLRTRWVLPDGSEWTPGYVSAEIPDAETGALAANAAPPAGLLGLALILVSGMFAACVAVAVRS